MRQTKKDYSVPPYAKRLVDVEELQILLCAGRVTAVRIGEEAQAKVKIGRRVFFNVSKIQNYLDKISE